MNFILSAIVSALINSGGAVMDYVKVHSEPSKVVAQSPEDSCKKDKDCELVAKAVLYEARGESLDGQKLVASVIVNRVEDDRFPDTIKDVVHQKKQFSFVADMHKQKKPSEKSLAKARKVAYTVLNSDKPVSNYLWYHNTSVKPKWSTKAKGVKKGNHVFYNNL